jgi:hypothetical protein
MKSDFEIQKNVSQTMRKLKFTSLRLQQELMQLHEGIDVASSGRLSLVLLPLNNLSALLQQSALTVCRDMSLIANTEIGNMYMYYGVSHVEAYCCIPYCCRKILGGCYNMLYWERLGRLSIYL